MYFLLLPSRDFQTSDEPVLRFIGNSTFQRPRKAEATVRSLHARENWKGTNLVSNESLAQCERYRFRSSDLSVSSFEALLSLEFWLPRFDYHGTFDSTYEWAADFYANSYSFFFLLFFFLLEDLIKKGKKYKHNKCCRLLDILRIYMYIHFIRSSISVVPNLGSTIRELLMRVINSEFLSINENLFSFRID